MITENNVIKRILSFKKDGLGDVRTVMDDEQNIWFFLNDLGRDLDITNVSDRYRKMCSSGEIKPTDRIEITYKACRDNNFLDFWGELSSSKNDYSNKVFVNEYAMYNFVIRSRKGVGRDLCNWITHEVLPSINRSGGYINGQELLSESDRKDLTEKISDLSNTIKDILHKNEKLTNSLIRTDEEYAKILEENTRLYLELDTLKERVSEKYRKYMPKEEPIAFSHKEPDGWYDVRSGLLNFGAKSYDKDSYDWDGFER